MLEKQIFNISRNTFGEIFSQLRMTGIYCINTLSILSDFEKLFEHKTALSINLSSFIIFKPKHYNISKIKNIYRRLIHCYFDKCRSYINETLWDLHYLEINPI